MPLNAPAILLVVIPHFGQSPRQVQYELTDLRLGEIPCETTRTAAGHTDGHGTPTVLDPLRVPGVSALQIGKHPLTGTLRLTVYQINDDRQRSAILAQRTISLSTPVELLPETESSVERVADPQHRAAMQAVAVADAHLTRDPAGGGPTLRFSLDYRMSRSPPVPLACTAFIRMAGREYPAGWLCYGPQSTSYQILPARIDGPLADTFDLVLRPDPDVAIRTLRVLEFWDEEVVLPAQRVRSAR